MLSQQLPPKVVVLMTENTSLPSLHKRPLALPAIAVALGILAGEHGLLPATVAVVVTIALLIALISHRPGPAIALALILIAGFLLGSARYTRYTRVDSMDISNVAPFKQATVVGVLQDDPDIRAHSARMIVAVSRAKVNGKWKSATGNLLGIRLGSGKAFREKLPKYGDRVVLYGQVVLPSEPRNPGEFSYKDYYARQRIYSEMFLRSQKQMRVIGHNAGNAPMTFASGIRRHMHESINRRISRNHAGIAAGMALGTYAALRDDVFTAFSRTGTLHLLAASGFNCAVLAYCVWYVTRVTKQRRRWSRAAAVPIFLLYMLVVGLKASIVRATIMASLLALGNVFRRVSDPLNVLFAAVLIILAWRPTDLFDIGFQLSFAAVVAIILFLPILRPWIEKAFRTDVLPGGRSSLGRTIRGGATHVTEAVAATFAATLGTLPITAHYFNQASIVSPLVNAAVALLAPPIFVFSLALPAVSGVPILGQTVGFVDQAMVWLMLKVVTGFSSLSWSCLPVSSPGALGAAGYYLVMGSGLVYLSRKTRGTA